MRKLIVLELKNMIPMFLFIHFGAFIFMVLALFTPIFYFVPPMCLYFANHLSRRSFWYLNLPWSRTKIMATIMLQSAIVCIANLLLTYFILYSMSHVAFMENHIEADDFTITGMCAVFFGLFASTLGVLAGKPVQRWTFSGMRELAIYAAFGCLLAIGWAIRLYDEPSVYWITLVTLPFLLFWFYCRQIVLPREHIQRVGRISQYGVGLIAFGPLVAAFFLANYGSLNSGFTTMSISLLGRIPVFMSDARAKELFEETTVSREPAMLGHLAALRSSFDLEAWEKRTKKCKSRSCLDLSSEAIDFEHLSATELGERFLTLMNRCELKFAEDGNVRCKGAYMYRPHFNKWMTALREKGVLNRWLAGDNAIEQIIALKGLMFELDSDQELRASELANSDDPQVAATAKRTISTQAAFAAAKLDCNAPKADRRDGLCRTRRSGPYTFF